MGKVEENLRENVIEKMKKEIRKLEEGGDIEEKEVEKRWKEGLVKIEKVIEGEGGRIEIEVVKKREKEGEGVKKVLEKEILIEIEV